MAVAEDMRMPADELLADRLRDGVEIEAAFRPSDIGVEDHLQQEVAEFLAQIRVVTGIDRGDDLVSLLQESGAKRGVSLFMVPRAAPGGAEHADNFAKAVDWWKSFGRRWLHGGVFITRAPAEKIAMRCNLGH